MNYYTAPVRIPGSRDRHGAFLEANRELNPDLLNLVNGFMQSDDCCHCKRCAKIFRRWQEKRTDVNMAVDIAMGAAARRFANADLITGDADQVGGGQRREDARGEVGGTTAACASFGSPHRCRRGTTHTYHLSEKQLNKVR